MEIREVRTAGERTQFVRFAHRIYRNDPQWVPPLEIERLEFLKPRVHPFYLHGEAQAFVAVDRGEIVGRVLASFDPQFLATHGIRRGAFGMFECIDDQNAARAVLKAAESWAMDRGCTEVWGPVDFSLSYQCGLLVDGFDTPPRVMMNHNPPYYEALIEAAGYHSVKDLYAYWFDDDWNLADLWRRRAERLARTKIVIRSPAKGDVYREFMRVAPTFNAAWQRNWGAVPMSEAEFKHLAKGIAQLAVPDLLLVAEIDGQPVGFSMSLPDLNEAIQPLGGRLTTWGLPIGLARLLYRIKRVKTVRLVALGILEEFRGRGVAELLILRTLEASKRVIGSTRAELSWTLEDNQRINRAIDAAGGKRYKTYRIYLKSIADAVPG